MHRPVLALSIILSLVLGASAFAGEPQARYHVMVTNDDGIDAPGIAALANALAADPTYRVTVVAPLLPQSGMGHALVIRHEVAVRPHDGIAGCRTWSVDATPASVVRMGLGTLLVDDPPDLVVSGINKGENVGLIAWYSGTVGAAREAALVGLPAVALSLQLNWEAPDPDFETAARWAKIVVDAVRDHGLPDGVYLNVNIPLEPEGIRGIRLARMGQEIDELNRYDLVREADGVRYYKSRWFPPSEFEHGGDNAALADGWITVVPLGLDSTDYRALPVLQDLGCLGPAELPVLP